MMQKNLVISPLIKIVIGIATLVCTATAIAWEEMSDLLFTMMM